MQVAVYADSIANPNLEASAHFTPGSPVAGLVLFDPASGLAHVAGADYSSAGFYASAERKLPRGNSIRISYANATEDLREGCARIQRFCQGLT